MFKFLDFSAVSQLWTMFVFEKVKFYIPNHSIEQYAFLFSIYIV